MTVEMYLNELSLNKPANDIYMARIMGSQLVQTTYVAIQLGLERVLRTHEKFFNLVMAPNYPISKWLNDSEVDKEIQRYIKTLTTKAPFWEGLPGLESGTYINEFSWQNQSAVGLGASYLMDGLAVSFESDEAWKSDKILILMKSIEDDIILKQDILVNHASNPDHVYKHNDWIQENIQSEAKKGQDLWEKRNRLFPSLIFCNSVENQLNEMEPVYFSSVRRRLFEIEAYCKIWKSKPIGTPFDSKGLLNIKTESEATLKRHGSERTFTCPDGKQRLFSWHIPLTPHARRIHFFPLSETCEIIIGYIGKHLPTSKYHN